ncbi:probable 2-oxoglutarate-dependent dioxygenase At3g111800 [Olea europaea var. sylvestris]|uniref:probable 2-oxoglutarate-dependent dioxygenase At3g111800 n=1 Tax=Olea europaea var. sylvestris TaxID=158386 RepID=UPI000C1D819B|nr:probable 2-oxoglutarate-dependent dioxygenase At3g111800 [Olea europaea var. sylvestris]
MNFLQKWPEPVVPVQHLSDSGIRVIPGRYVKKPSERPSSVDSAEPDINIPVIDLQELYSDDHLLRRRTASLIDSACREWGFFQVVNHGVSHELMARTREAWREFFHLPMAEKKKYANSPSTYEGYGSRLGVEKGISLDWNDYFFLHYLPVAIRDRNKWPALPVSCRELIEKYSEEVVNLGEKLMKILSVNLGLRENYLSEAFGGDDNGACLRVNYYPKCPQPDLTLGISSHSDPGGMTLLNPDENVSGLQVRHGAIWLTVNPLPNAFIINIGNKVAVVSNGKYKSVEHRVIVNSEKERVSLAFFYNPRGEMPIKPAEELVSEEHPALYPCMTFDEYRLYFRTRGPSGKIQVESLKSHP